MFRPFSPPGLFVVLLMGLISFGGLLKAAPGDVDPSFSENIGSWVLAVAVQPDGKVLIGGEFQTIAGQPARRIARLNRDGTHDQTFTAGVDGSVEGIAVQTDGKILVSGNFDEASGQARAGIVRFLPDGRVDETFQCSADGFVYRLLLLKSGKILIGGRFDQVNGAAVKNLVLLNEDGSTDTSFSCNVERTDTWAALYAMAELSDGNILIGGTFNSAGGYLKSNLAKITGTGQLVHEFAPNPSGTVSCVVEQPDGKILIGGSFPQYLARLTADGSVDPYSLHPLLSLDDAVTSIALQADGKVVIGGMFTRLKLNQPAGRIARLQANGIPDSGFVANSNRRVYVAVVAGDGSIYAGGQFTQINDTAVRMVARMKNDPTSESIEIASGDVLRWTRSGTGPEMSDVDVLFSQNGKQWSRIGSAVRVTGGWEFPVSSFTTPGFFRARGRALISNRASATAEATLLRGRVMTPLEAWRNQNFGQATDEYLAADQADGDRDGNPNLIEYAFLSDPKVGDASSSPTWVRGSGAYEFTFERSSLTPDVSLQAEWSTSMRADDWHMIPNASAAPHFRFNVLVDEYPKKFFRIRAVNP